MMCTFCGSQNRTENRFCGMCGVRLERRMAERRTNTAGAIQCPSCGHTNEPGYKFCGMCGGRVERRVEERRGSGERANATANAQLPPPERTEKREQPAVLRDRVIPNYAPSASASVPDRRTELSSQQNIRSSASIGGPSFLGLNAEPLNEGEYLLEDEASSRGGLRTLVLLVILAAILGLIFVQWRSSYRANPKSPQPSKPDAAQKAQPQSKNEPTAAATGNTRDSNSETAAVKKNPDELTPASSPKQMAQNAENADSSDPVDNKRVDKKKAATIEEKPETRDDSAEAQDDTADDATAAKPASRVPQKPSPALIKAQRYLQGRGVPQSCEQGLMYLKAATEDNDPGAAVQMGALYSSGHCVQQDLVKAYKWFASAHDMQPENRWIEKNLNQLWAQMTPDERRRVQ